MLKLRLHKEIVLLQATLRVRAAGVRSVEQWNTLGSVSVAPSPTRMLTSGVYAQRSCLFGCSTIWGGAVGAQLQSSLLFGFLFTTWMCIPS